MLEIYINNNTTLYMFVRDIYNTTLYVSCVLLLTHLYLYIHSLNRDQTHKTLVLVWKPLDKSFAKCKLCKRNKRNAKYI